MFFAVFHQVEDGDGDQVGHKHKHLPPLDRPANSLTALQDLQINQKLGTIALEEELAGSVLYFANFFEKLGKHLCFGLPAVVVSVQEVTAYRLSTARGGARVASETVSVAGCCLTQGIMDAAGAVTCNGWVKAYHTGEDEQGEKKRTEHLEVLDSLI